MTRDNLGFVGVLSSWLPVTAFSCRPISQNGADWVQYANIGRTTGNSRSSPFPKPRSVARTREPNSAFLFTVREIYNSTCSAQLRVSRLTDTGGVLGGFERRNRE